MLHRDEFVECLADPRAYSMKQVRESLAVANALNRGPFVLTEAPAKCPRCFDEPETFCCECGRS